QPFPISASSDRPVNSSQGPLKYVHSWSTPDIQIITGAVFATRRKRSSLSRRAASMRLRSVMSTTELSTNLPSGVSTGFKTISTATSVPSFRRPYRSRPAPIGSADFRKSHHGTLNDHGEDVPGPTLQSTCPSVPHGHSQTTSLGVHWCAQFGHADQS